MVWRLSNLKYFVIYKPYQVLSQFTSSDGKANLSIFGFPKNFYSVGRLDYDSEGLLIITNDRRLNSLLLSPKRLHKRTYYVQVEGSPTDEDLRKLAIGVEINLQGRIYRTKQSIVNILEKDPILPERIPPIRYRKNIPTTWLSITLTEGKNRQVRKMTAKIGFPTLRLVRFAIEELTIEGFSSGEVREISYETLRKKLKI
jgi:23S rRNA pseudouridine2457 synthase